MVISELFWISIIGFTCQIYGLETADARLRPEMIFPPTVVSQMCAFERLLLIGLKDCPFNFLDQEMEFISTAQL